MLASLDILDLLFLVLISAATVALVHNKLFWNQRYTTLPQLGSGPGSRGYAAAYKNRLIRRILQSEPVKTLIDIGCGDLCWLDDEILKQTEFIGVDISNVIVQKNIQRFPTLTFLEHDIATAPIGRKADLVVCLDVLIHQISRNDFVSSLNNILSAIGRLGLISYRTPPNPDGKAPPPETVASDDELLLQSEASFAEMMSALPAYERARTSFHGDLPGQVMSISRNFVAQPLARYRAQTVYLITRKVDG